MAKVLIWDWPVRLGHGLLAGGFIVCWLTSESETWRLVHVFSGALVLAASTFRLLWGVIGSRHARFSAFLRGPAAVRAYLSSLLKLQPAAHSGHNPAGGWAIIAMLCLALATSASGWLMYQEIGGEFLEEGHEALAASLLGVVFIHLAGVISGSLLHGENLPRALLTGYKEGLPSEAIASRHRLAAFVLLLWAAVLGVLVLR